MLLELFSEYLCLLLVRMYVCVCVCVSVIFNNGSKLHVAAALSLGYGRDDAAHSQYNHP